MHLVLASTSPRRRELIERLHLPYVIRAVSVDEKEAIRHFLNEYPEERHTASELAEYLAKAKADATQRKRGEVLITADTVVAMGATFLGKPTDESDAVAMLKRLCGKTHRVATGVCVRGENGDRSFSVHADVSFFPYDAWQEKLILDYVRSGHSMDKAGAYGIQDEGALFIDTICGDYYAVVGLPIARLYRVLCKNYPELLLTDE